MITHDEARKHLDYDPSTGLFWWKISGAGRPFIKPAGRIQGDGYLYVQVNRKRYKAHRLAWLWMKGEFPCLDVEHRNRVKTDNSWSNLRLATDSQNQANTGCRIDNSSGYKGVAYRPDNRKWRARIQVGKRRFNLGAFFTPEEAHAAYVAAAEKHFGEYARAR